MISCQELLGDATAADHVSALARQAFDRSQAARQPVGCLAFCIDYRSLLVSAHGEPWVRGMESEVLASLEVLVGEGEAFLLTNGQGARLWITGLGAEPLAALAKRILTSIRERACLTPTGVQPITLSLGMACSDRAEPAFDPAFCLETLEAVADEGLELAVDGGGDRVAHSELYGILQATRARHEPEAVAAQVRCVRDLIQVAEREAQARAAESRAAQEQTATEAQRVRRAAVETHDPEVAELVGPRGPLDLPRVQGDRRATGSGEALTQELRSLLDALRDGRREPAAVELRIAELVQARLTLERRRVGQEKDQAYGSQVDKLERRLSKLNDALERTEERLTAGLQPSVDTGASSAFRSVQGLSRDEPEYELKRNLMAQIFEANLELARWTTGHGA